VEVEALVGPFPWDPDRGRLSMAGLMAMGAFLIALLAGGAIAASSVPRTRWEHPRMVPRLSEWRRRLLSCRTSLIARALTTGAASSSAARAIAQAVGSRVGATFRTVPNSSTGVGASAVRVAFDVTR
jgi:hypothetical protein